MGLACVAACMAALAMAPASIAAPDARAHATLLEAARRYAPILWPAPAEPYLPTIPWGSAAGDSARGARVGYRQARAAGGITIHQYWMYFARDVGHRGHEHDAEVFSVFVDSTGEAVGAAGSAHGPGTLNNIVRRRASQEAPLPEHLHVLVEYGKHACAPDVDGDGRFEPGIDANVLGGEAWGVRDAHPRQPEDRIFEASAVPAGVVGAQAYDFYLVDELEATAARAPAAAAATAAPDPRRDLWLHGSYAAPEGVLEPWLTDDVAVTAAAAYEIGEAVLVRLGLVWARDGGPLGERAIEPFASYNFAQKRVSDFGILVHENRSGGPGLRYGAWGNDGASGFDFGIALGATFLRWDRGGIEGLGHGNVTLALDVHADVTNLGDSKLVVSLGLGFPFVSSEPARRLFTR